MKIRNKFLKKVLKYPSDVILFHGLLWHRASQPNWKKVKQIDGYGIENPPDDKESLCFNGKLEKIIIIPKYMRLINQKNKKIFIEKQQKHH